MKGDERRAEALAIYLDGGPLAEELEPLEPVLKRVRASIAELAPDAERLRTLGDELFASPPSIAPALETVTIRVGAMDASLAFYRDTLGLPARRVSPRTSLLGAGDALLQLQHAPTNAAAPSAELEFRTPDIDGTVDRLRQHDVPLRIRTDRALGRSIELRDPDGHLVIVRQRTR